MKTKKNFLKKLAAVTLGFVMTLGVGAAGYSASAGEAKAGSTKVTYAQSSTSAASVSSGTAPSGTSVTFSNTYNTKDQLTSGNSMTWTFSGYSGYKISNIKANLHKNSSKGSGTFQIKNNGTSVTTKTYAASDLNPTNYREETVYTTEFTCNGNLEFLLVSTANSFYCSYVSFEWEKAVTNVTATFDGNGVSNPASQTVPAGTSITLPTPEYTGHKFEGWQINGSGTDYTGLYTLNASTTFVAHWSPIKTLDHIALSNETAGYKIGTSTYSKPTVLAYYSGDAKGYDVTNKATFTGSVDMNVAGPKSVTVSYSEGGSSDSKTYNFTVYGIYSYSLNSASANPTAVVDQPWSFTGLKVDAVYKNNAGDQAFATDTLTYGTDDFSVSSHDSTATAGNKNITVIVTYKNITHSISNVAATVVDIPTYTKVTSEPTDWSGEYIIAYLQDATHALVFNGVDKAQDTILATVSDNKITYDDDMAKLTVASIDGGYSIKVSTTASDTTGSGVINLNNMYIGGTSGSNGFNYSLTTAVLNTFSFDDEHDTVTISSNSTSLRYNSDETLNQYGNYNNLRFRYYKTTTTGASYIYPTIFKLEEPSVTLDSLTLSGQTQSFILNDEFTFDGTVTANYSDNTHPVVTNDATYSIKKSSETTYSSIPSALDLDYDGATVKVSYTDAKNRSAEATYTISVKYADATSISITGGDNVEINVGQTFTVSATVSPSNANQVFTVSGGGTHTTLSEKTITGDSEGTDTFTVKSYDGKASTTLTVNVVASPSIVISPTTISGVYSGNNGTITVESYNTKGGTITYDWTVTDADPVGCVTLANATTSVGSNTINYVAEGTAKVHVVGKENGVAFDNGDCAVTVTASTVTGLTITKGGVDAGATVAYKGESIILDASMTGVGNQGRVTWSLESGKEALASITPSLSDNKVTITSVSDDVILTCTSQLDSTKFDSVTLKVFNIELFTASTATQFPLYKGANLINALAIEEVTATFNDSSTLKKSAGQLKLLADNKEELNGSDEYYVALFTKGGTFNRRLYTTDTLTSEMDGMRLGIIYKYGETQKQTVKTNGLQVSEYLQPISTTESTKITVSNTDTLDPDDVPSDKCGDILANRTFGHVTLLGDKNTGSTQPRFWNTSSGKELRTYTGNKLTFTVDIADAKITAITCANIDDSITIPEGTGNSITLSAIAKNSKANISVTYSYESSSTTTIYHTITENAATSGNLTYNAQYEAVRFAEEFNALNTDSVEFNWQTVSTSFSQHLSKLSTDAEKKSFTDIFELAERGTADSVQTCVKEYDRVVAKYNRDDFMNRGIEATKYTFAYELFDGTRETGDGTDPSTEYTYGQLIELPSNVTKAGYSLDGWFSKDGSQSDDWGTQYTSSFYLTGNTTLYAKWSAKQYTVTFNGNGGGWSSATTEPVTETHGSNYVLPKNNPTREGYEFDGWWTTSDNTGSQVTTSTVVNVIDNNTVIYAHWDGKQQSITFVDTNIIDSGSGSCKVGETYSTTISANPGFLLPDELTATVNGQTFTGFSYVKSTGSFTITSMPAGDVIISGSAYQGAYTISYYDGETPIDEPQLIKSYNYGVGVASLAEANDKKGYSFAGWYDNSDLTGLPVTSISASESGTKTFYAKWAFNAQDALNSVQTSIGMSYTYQKDAETPIISHSEPTTKAETRAAAAYHYERVITAPTDLSGEYLLVGQNNSSKKYYALNSSATTASTDGKGTIPVTQVTPSSDASTISSSEAVDSCVIQILKNSNGFYSIKCGNYYIGASKDSNNELYTSTVSTTYQQELVFNSETYKVDIKNVFGDADHGSDTSKLQMLNSNGSEVFKFYKSSQVTCWLYKKVSDVKPVESIEIVGTPSKTTYNVGEAYSAAGLSVKATYEGGSQETVTATIEPSKQYAEAGDTSVTFSASYEGKTASLPVNVTVNSVYSNVSFKFNFKNTGMDALVSEYGDAFDDIGLVVEYGGRTRYFSFIPDDRGNYYIYEDGEDPTTFKMKDGGVFTMSLGDVINNLDRAATEFTVKAYIRDGENYYYSSNSTTYSVMSWISYYHSKSDYKDAVEDLYNIFFPNAQ